MSDSHVEERPAGRDNPGVIMRPPLLYVTALLAGLLADHSWPLIEVTLPIRLLHLSGMAIGLPGIALLVWASRRFRDAGTNVPTNLPAKTIVTGGPYQLSRNPIYIALTLIYAGLAVAAGSIWSLVLLVPLLAIMRYGVIAREETYLAAKFGETYLAYKDKVRRWL